MTSIGDLRREYASRALVESDAFADPFQQFGLWFDEAVKAALLEVNAMTLATSSPQGEPSARIVLLKAYDEHGFVFFTYYESAKGRDLEANPRSAKAGAVTADIIESIQDTPETFPFKTKGVLVGASDYEPLQRHRYELRFENTKIEGILDGGHNMLDAHFGLGDAAVIDSLVCDWPSGQRDVLTSVGVDTLRTLVEGLGFTGVRTAPGRDALLQFSGVAPNPARGAVRWSFATAGPARVRLDVFDLAGRHRGRLAEGDVGAGPHAWTTPLPPALAAGIYFAVLSGPGAPQSRRFTILP